MLTPAKRRHLAPGFGDAVAKIFCFCFQLLSQVCECMVLLFLSDRQFSLTPFTLKWNDLPVTLGLCGGGQLLNSLLYQNWD